MDLQRSGGFIKTQNNGFYIALSSPLLDHEVGDVGGGLTEPEVKTWQLKAIVTIRTLTGKYH